MRVRGVQPKVGIGKATIGAEPSGFGLALVNFTVQRASASFCAALASLSGHISAAVLPALIPALSALVFRCRGAGIRLASTTDPAFRRAPQRPQTHEGGIRPYRFLNPQG